MTDVRFLEGETFDQDLKRCDGIKQDMKGAGRLRGTTKPSR